MNNKNKPSQELLATSADVVTKVLEVPLFDTIGLSYILKAKSALHSIRDIYFYNKISRFIEGLEYQSAEDHAHLELVNPIEDQLSRKKIGEAVFSWIENADSTTKIDYYAVIFSAFRKGEIDQVQMRFFGHIINKAFLDDLENFISEYSKYGYIASGSFANSTLKDLAWIEGENTLPHMGHLNYALLPESELLFKMLADFK